MNGQPAPIIVTALFGRQDTAFFDAMRREHFPAERNQLAAHLTMFHHLSPSIEGELKHRLIEETRGVRAAQARVAGLFSLGRGVAYRIVSPSLDAIRRKVADNFHGSLSAQDAQGWRPHVTIMNKAKPSDAKALLDELQGSFQPRPLAITGLALHRYLGGPWEKLGSWSFRGR